ncbi:MAG: efflux RND transporter periplasmic adaptor subunit [Acidobacteria bacterium]|nr:efflux RND transporter periplasmic adaptor subunit [Acidobacteriota bacterium]
MNTKIRYVIGVFFCLMFAAGCRKAESFQKPVKPVQVQEVQSFLPGGASANGERYSANILPASQNELAFKFGGYVSEIFQVKGADGRLRPVQEGDTVAKGTVLARLRNDDFAAKIKQAESQVAEAQSTTETNRAQLAEAESALRQAERDLERATKLLEAKSLTKPEYEGAKTKVEMAQARVETVRSQARVIQAKISGAQALLGEAKLAEKDAALIAPMDCYILKRLIEPGGLTAPGRPVFVVADKTSVKATFGLPDLSLKNIGIGEALTFTTEAIPGMEFKGWVSRISPAADPKSRVFDVEATIPRPPSQLRLGMIASLSLPSSKSAAPVTVIPINAIVRPKQNPESYAVNVVTDQGGNQFAKQRLVKLGEAYGNMIAVTEGVTLGERVIVSGAAMIVDGEQVKVIPSTEK